VPTRWSKTDFQTLAHGEHRWIRWQEENVEEGGYASTEKRTDAEEGQRQDGGRHNDRQQE